MLSNLKRRMFPITLSRGLEIIQSMTSHETDTDKWYGNTLNHFMKRQGDLLVRDITPEMVFDWSKSLDLEMAATGNPYSEWTKNSYRRSLKAYFNKLVNVGHLDPPGPAARLRIPSPPKGQPKHLSEEEVGRLRRHARKTTREHAIIEMMHATGCRLSDLLTMRVTSLAIDEYSSEGHLNEDEKELISLAKSSELSHVIKPEFLGRYRGKILVIGKGQEGKKKPRFVFFGDETARALLAYLETRPHEAPDNLWLTVSGTPMARNTIYAAFKNVASDAGIDCAPHDLRHTFAFRLIRNGADAKIVQELLGHSDLSTTMNVYYNLSDAELWQAYEQFG